jgi:nucleotide-binding universal stress UspA family protein
MGPDILLPIRTYPDPTPKAAVARALNVLARLGPRLTVVIHEADIAPIYNALAEITIRVTEMAAIAEARSRERARDIASWTQEWAGRLGLRIVVETARCRLEGFADHLKHLARTHDFSVLPIDTGGIDQLRFAEDLIFGAGGPVIIVPADGASIPAIGETAVPMSVFVAWDGSRAAARALRDAVSILALADSVSIVTVEDDKFIDPKSTSGAGEYLARHGIASRHLGFDRGTAPIGDALQVFAVSNDADLLVMGAYGHSRVQEFVLGGATRTVLREARLPILLSH